MRALSFLLHLKRDGREAAVISTTDLEESEQLEKILRAAGYAVTVTHFSPAVAITKTKGETGETN